MRETVKIFQNHTCYSMLQGTRFEAKLNRCLISNWHMNGWNQGIPGLHTISRIWGKWFGGTGTVPLLVLVAAQKAPIPPTGAGSGSLSKRPVDHLRFIYLWLLDRELRTMRNSVISYIVH
ncbi:hypothetical protein F4815DRAFT_110942 [Daldinia loculata]|nr:hypothetical protein F4815DRAFT_110942 [Daldinia loculata]